MNKVIGMVCVSALLLSCSPSVAVSQTYKEKDLNAAYCAQIGGKTEVRHYFSYNGKRGYVVVDCETATKVIEGGLDKRRSLDSIQQALFFSAITGKTPEVIIYDTDGDVGVYEYRITTACREIGLTCRTGRVR